MTSLQNSSKDTTVGFTDEELDAIFADCAPGSDGLATSNLQMTEFVHLDDWLFGVDGSPDFSCLTTNLQMTRSSLGDNSREDWSLPAEAPSSIATATPATTIFPPVHGWNGQILGTLYDVSAVQDDYFGNSEPSIAGMLDHQFLLEDLVDQPMQLQLQDDPDRKFSLAKACEASHVEERVSLFFPDQVFPVRHDVSPEGYLWMLRPYP